MSTHRVAIIGLGMAVGPHAKSLADLAQRVEVVAAFSPTTGRREAFTQTYGFPISGDLDAIFDDRSIEALLILTPPNTHLDLVQRAAATGKHVLLEKPLEVSIERSQALVAAAENAGITLGVVLQHRFKPAADTLRKIIDDGRLGTIVSASTRIRNWRPQSYYDQPGRGTRARDGGGVLLTQAIHTLDLLIWLAGQPAEVTAYAGTTPVHRMETEDMVAAALRYVGGAMGTINATACAWPGYPDAIEIIGTLGVAELEGTTLSVAFHDGTSEKMGEAETGGAGADPMAFGHHHHRAVLADFLDAIEAGRRPRADGREALKVHALIDAILRSSANGQRQVV